MNEGYMCSSGLQGCSGEASEETSPSTGACIRSHKVGSPNYVILPQKRRRRRKKTQEPHGGGQQKNKAAHVSGVPLPFMACQLLAVPQFTNRKATTRAAHCSDNAVRMVALEDVKKLKVQVRGLVQGQVLDRLIYPPSWDPSSAVCPRRSSVMSLRRWGCPRLGSRRS